MHFRTKSINAIDAYFDLVFVFFHNTHWNFIYVSLIHCVLNDQRLRATLTLIQFNYHKRNGYGHWLNDAQFPSMWLIKMDTCIPVDAAAAAAVEATANAAITQKFYNLFTTMLVYWSIKTAFDRYLICPFASCQLNSLNTVYVQIIMDWFVSKAMSWFQSITLCVCFSILRFSFLLQFNFFPIFYLFRVFRSL